MEDSKRFINDEECNNDFYWFNYNKILTMQF